MRMSGDAAVTRCCCEILCCFEVLLRDVCCARGVVKEARRASSPMPSSFPSAKRVHANGYGAHVFEFEARAVVAAALVVGLGAEIDPEHPTCGERAKEREHAQRAAVRQRRRRSAERGQASAHVVCARARQSRAGRMQADLRERRAWRGRGSGGASHESGSPPPRPSPSSARQPGGREIVRS
eukprot:2980666-Rhodomonas_salina.1